MPSTFPLPWRPPHDPHPSPLAARSPAVLVLVARVAACRRPRRGPLPSPPPPRPRGLGGAVRRRQADCPTSQPEPCPPARPGPSRSTTNLGSIDLAIEADLSPIAAGNFVALAECGYYDGVVFHRVVPGFVIQGGDGETAAERDQDRDRRPGLHDQGRAGHRRVRARGRGHGPHVAAGLGRLAVLHRPRRRRRARPSPAHNTYQIIGHVTSGMETADAIAAARRPAEIPTNAGPRWPTSRQHTVTRRATRRPAEGATHDPRDHQHRPRRHRDRPVRHGRPQGDPELHRPRPARASTTRSSSTGSSRASSSRPATASTARSRR